MRDAREAVVDKKTSKKFDLRFDKSPNRDILNPTPLLSNLLKVGGGWWKSLKKVENKIWQIFKLWYIKSHALIDEREDKLSRWLMR